MKLLSVKPATDGKHKYTAKFLKDNGRTKTTNFGAKGYDDYTLTGDKDARTLYLIRHKPREDWNDPTSAGSLARYLLWGASSSFAENLAAFKRRFNL